MPVGKFSDTPIGKATEGIPRQLPEAMKIKLLDNSSGPLSVSRSVSIGHGGLVQVGPIQTAYSVRNADHRRLSRRLSISASSRLIPFSRNCLDSRSS